MRLNWKVLRLAAIPVGLLLCSGCSGVNATGSVSPASFFLPGLLQADPPAALPQLNPPAPKVEPGTEVAKF